MLDTGTATAAKDGEAWTIRALLARHKLAGLVAAAAIAVMVALLIVGLLGPRAGAVSDSTSCSQWGSANRDQQAAYARLYVREHGPLRGRGVIAAINAGCAQAFGEDVSDSVTVVRAISGNF